MVFKPLAQSDLLCEISETIESLADVITSARIMVAEKSIMTSSTKTQESNRELSYPL